MKKNKSSHGILLSVLCGYFVLSVLYSYVTPLWSPPDEVRHFSYCEYIARNHSLPYLDAAMEGGHVTQSVHPPLYYIIGSFFCRDITRPIQETVFINDGPSGSIISHPENESRFPYSGKARGAHLLRLFSIFCGVLTVWMVFRIGLLISSGDVLCATLAAVFVATLPQFLHISASISNENLSTFLATLYMFYLLNFLQDRFTKRTVLLAGLTLGCCLLTKSSSIFFVPLTVFVFSWMWFRDRNKSFFLNLAAVLCVGGGLSSWWYVRNWYLYDDPIFTKALEALQPWSLRPRPLTVDYVCDAFSRSLVSFFGNFGSMQFAINQVQLSLYVGLAGCSFVGLILYVKTNYTRRDALQSLIALMVCFLGVACFFFLANFRYTMFMGRYFFVSIASIAVFFSVGILNFLPRRAGRFFSFICLVILVGLCVDVFGRVIIPAYQNFYVKEDTVQNDFCCLSDVFSGATSIHQTFVSRKKNLSGIRVLVDASSNRGALLSIKEHGASRPVIYSVLFKPEGRDRFQYCFFMFPPLVDSKERKYDFTISSAEETTIALWYTSEDMYAGGKMYVNQVPTGGDLFFATYYCDNSEFVDKWHESEQITVKQKLFICFSELQLSYEMEKDFRAHSAVQLKIDQINRL